jgi:hypothetical protein
VPGGHDLGDGLLAQVEGFDTVAGLGQIDGHGGTHIAQTDKSDLHVCLLAVIELIASSALSISD